MIIVSDPNVMGKNCVHRAWMCLFAVLSLSLVAQAQPAVERITDGDIVYLDREWRLIWEVRWHGAADAYMILPPEIEEMDWAAVAPGPSESFVRDGEMWFCSPFWLPLANWARSRFPGLKLAT